MALTNQVLMPGADYQAICDQTRRLTGETATLTSGEVVTKLSGVTVGGGGASVQTSKAVSVSANGTETITPDDGYDAMAEIVLTVSVPSGGGGEQPQLLAPTISVTEDLLTITPNPANGGFVSGWRGYAAVGDGDFALLGTLPADTLTLDLTQQGLPAAAYRFKATAIGDNFVESDASNIVAYTNVFYAITKTLSNCAANNDAATIRAGSAFAATLTPSAGYTMSGATVTVTMGDEDSTATAYSNGAISIAQVTGDVVITVTAVEVNTLTFSQATLPFTLNRQAGYTCLGYGAGKFVLLAYGQNVHTSIDGVNWTDEGVPSPRLETARTVMTYANGKFYYVTTGASSIYCGTSDDGIIWDVKNTGLPLATVGRCAALAPCDGAVACACNNKFYVWDGITFEERTKNGNAATLSFIGNKFYALDADAADGIYPISVYTSSDMETWDTITTGLSVSNSYRACNNGFVHFNGRYINVVNRTSTSLTPVVICSADGESWSELVPNASPAQNQYNVKPVATTKFLCLVPSDVQNKDVKTVRYTSDYTTWHAAQMADGVASSNNSASVYIAYGGGKLLVLKGLSANYDVAEC